MGDARPGWVPDGWTSGFDGVSGSKLPLINHIVVAAERTLASNHLVALVGSIASNDVGQPAR